MSKAPSQVSVQQAITMLTKHVAKIQYEHKHNVRDIEQRLGEITESVNSSVPDMDSFIKPMAALHAKCTDYEKRIAKLEAALQLSAPPKKAKGGTVKIEPIETEVSFT
jgi:hypothetical protein